MRLKIHHIDAFTDTVFKGNYAAVIITEQWLSDSLMQSIAIENNLSETAFAKVTGLNSYEIRWFSPITEIDFCGHATLAAAFVLFKQDPDIPQLDFYAKALGHLTIRQRPNGYIEMCFPNQKPERISTVPQALLDGLSITPQQVLLNQQAYFAVYDNPQDVHAVQTNRAALMQLAPHDVVVTASTVIGNTGTGNDGAVSPEHISENSPEHISENSLEDGPAETDFISRYFWPANGGDEDPVTGSIHTGLAPYWAERLGKTTLTAYQASERGGVLQCHVTDNAVVISGQAVQYLEGYIEV
jgi:predicted PhzF superfamily epimerase YddE/YHI9